MLAERLRATVTAADALLTPRRVRRYALLMLVVTLALYAGAIATGRPPFDAFGKPIAVDLVPRVAAGRLALEGDLAHLYDVQQQHATQEELLSASRAGVLNLFVSPPFVALLYAPLAALPYLLAAWLWMTASAALLVLSLRLLWPLVPGVHRYGFGPALLVALSSPPVTELVGGGQDSALALLLLAGGLRLLAGGRDLAAGALLGLGVYKPQLFWLLPVALALQRRWRALAGWVGVAAALAAGSVALVGFEGALSYLALLGSDLYQTGTATSHGWKIQTLGNFARALLPPPWSFLADPIAVLAGLGLVALFAVAARRRTHDTRELALLVALAVLATALVNVHFVLYDGVVLFLPAVVLLNEAGDRAGMRVALAALYVVAWTAAVRYTLFGQAPWPLAALAGPWTLVPLAALFVIGCRLARPSRAGRGAPVAG